MKTQLLKKPLAIFIAVAMIITSFGGLATVSYAADKPVKFSVEISSVVSGSEKGVVKGEVYSDYTGKLVVIGDRVSASNATVTVTMSDVASLGVSGTRTYSREMKFNSTAVVGMNNVTELFDKLDNTSVAFTFGDKSVDYKISGKGGTYTLTPEGDAAAVWHAMVNEENFEYGVKDDEDSYAVVGNGSWLKAGNSKLEFEENYTDDLILDNFGDLTTLNQNIRNAVRLSTTEDTTEGVSFFVTDGTEIALGSSYAKLKDPASFDFAVDNYAAIEDSLKQLRDMTGEDTTDMMQKLFGVMDSVFTAIGGASVEGTGTIDPIPEEVPADKQPLKDLVMQAVNKLGEGTFTADSFKAMVESINKALDVIADEKATQDDIDAAYNNLNTTFANLKPEDKAANGSGNGNAAAQSAVTVGSVHNIGGSMYEVISLDPPKARLAKAKNAKTVTIPKAVMITGKSYNVTGIKAKAFKGTKVKKVNVKTPFFTKKAVNKSLKGSKVKNIKVKIGKKKINKKYIKKYKKYFTKKNAGKKAKVK